ncbi:MAG: ABC transporter ATP-binding protein [Candidatus Falkowbacteria bacterium]|nr:ABC transporter ATP-binding protein [Candidatus Falkowbacteria bacterium]
MTLILNYLKKYKKRLALILGLATINQVFSLLDPQFFRLIIDNYIGHVKELSSSAFISGVALLLLGSVTAALFSRIAKNFQDYYANYLTKTIGTTLYSKAIEHSMSLPYSVFEDQKSGEILQKIQKARIDNETIITSSINILFVSIIGLLFVLIYALTVHWSIFLMFFLLLPTLGGLTFFISKKIKQAQQNIVMRMGSLAGSTTETLRNVELVKSLGLEKQETDRLNEVNLQILGLELTKIKLIRKLSFIQGTLINLCRSGILFLMFWLIFKETISVGQFMSLLFYSFFIFNPLYQLSDVASQYQEAKASNEVLDKILKMPPEKTEGRTKELSKIQTLAFENLDFKYGSEAKPALANINLTIKAGQTVAFVGPSGAGKTSLIKLLLGLYQPSKGSIKINQENLFDFNPITFKQKISYVSQDTQLFAGTIKDNLLFVKPIASDKDCLEALEQAAALSIISRGTDGLDTKIGEGGLKLSGGEKQRLAIARALLRQPDLIIFDEATSSLDSITEHEITETIKAITKAKPELITILIAHRLSTIMHADEIYVLEKGSISESGSHENLLKEPGLYNALWRQQKGEENQLLVDSN